MRIARRHDTTPDVEPTSWAYLHFVPRGAPPFTVDLRTCPFGIPRFSHWNADGTCRCEVVE